MLVRHQLNPRILLPPNLPGPWSDGLWPLGGNDGASQCRIQTVGGLVADIIYKYTKSGWAKKIWLVFVGISFSVFLLVIGLANLQEKATMIGLVTGYTFFMAASNGANFAVVPHVHPYANGIVSGLVGSFGNLGGIIFAIVFRCYHTDYHKSVWIIGIICLAVNLAMC
ncbi:hypothetical protein VTO42DRAFT_5607 [Malbranchea cinnamomea]